MSFYIFSLIILLSRFLCYFLLLVYYYQSPHSADTALTAQNIQGISIYADICLGMFQVAAMRVLTLQLRNENREQLATSEQRIYRTCMIFTFLFWLGVLIDTAISVACSLNETNEASCLSGSNKQKSQYINGTFFAVLFLLMSITAIPLC